MNIRIDTNHQYRFPSEVKLVKHRGKIIAVLPETSNWIVLDNDIQVEILTALSFNKISYVLEKYDQNYNDCISVITQIEARHLESDAVSRNTSYSMHLYLTNECNMRCPHCYMIAGEKNENELTTQEIKSLLSDFKKLGGIGVILSGGEIGLRSDLVEIITYAHTVELKVDILSNGTLLTEDIVNKIAHYINRAQISIDGFSEETNAKIRGKGNFQKALNAIDLLISHNVNTEIAITPFPDKELNIYTNDYIRFGQKLKEKYGDKLNIKITTEILEGRNINLTAEEKNQYTDITEKIACAIVGDVSGKGGFVRSARIRVINDNCSYGNINIASNGDVYPCAKIGQCTKIGNIRNQKFETIMDISHHLEQVSNVNNLIPCKDCELKYICGGECRINYFPEFRTADILNSDSSPSRYCPKEYKESMLDLLIETNEAIFT